MLLAIDTSAGSSVALVDASARVLAEAAVEDSRRHAEVIGDLMAQCLEATSRSALTGVVVGMGPGPFTGLRVGIAAARAFARGRELPVLPLVSHDAIALADARDGGTGAVLVTTDARRRERYWSVYEGPDVDGVPRRSAGPGLARPDELDTVVPGAASLRRVDATWLRASDLGILAVRMRAAGRPFAPLGALYLRAPDATANAGPKRVTA